MTDRDILVGTMGFVANTDDEDVLLYGTLDWQIKILLSDNKIRNVYVTALGILIPFSGVTNWQEVRQLVKYITNRYPI